MLSEYFMDEASPSAKCSSGADVGFCKPVSGKLLAGRCNHYERIIMRGEKPNTAPRETLIKWSPTQNAFASLPCQSDIITHQRSSEEMQTQLVDIGRFDSHHSKPPDLLTVKFVSSPFTGENTIPLIMYSHLPYMVFNWDNQSTLSIHQGPV
ncbi:hypothetical protein OIU85_020936 [Salix viminalis]|uniref:Uncharacterized protein n=1 Tax=Salix viminalis TaxID=40686 RepID=A0A9Q0UHL4_SALVM|nr:hypothetical protein OIU85_020936 [Salix viminalis]